MIIQQESACSSSPCRGAVWSIARRETAPPGKPSSYLIHMWLLCRRNNGLFAAVTRVALSAWPRSQHQPVCMNAGFIFLSEPTKKKTRTAAIEYSLECFNNLWSNWSKDTVRFLNHTTICSRTFLCTGVSKWTLSSSLAPSASLQGLKHSVSSSV